MSTKIIRQKLANSSRRVLEKMDLIEEVMGGSPLTKYQAARLLMEVEKKVAIFQKHLDELEGVAKNDEKEMKRFLKDYDSLDEILNRAHELLSKLQYIVKYPRQHNNLHKHHHPDAQDLDTLKRGCGSPKASDKFDGNILNWAGFWDNYEAKIHANPRILTPDKFAYLRRHVEGPAKDLISGIDKNGFS